MKHSSRSSCALARASARVVCACRVSSPRQSMVEAPSRARQSRSQNLRVKCCISEPVAHDKVRLRDRRRRFLAWERHRRRLPRRHPRLPRHPRHQSQARSLHQRRSRHDEPVPARRSVRHRRRRRDRPRPRPLRALRRREDGQAQQLHDRPDLRERHPQGAPRRLSRRHRAGHPAHHRRDQELDRERRVGDDAEVEPIGRRSAAPSATSSRCRSSKRSARWASRWAARTSATSI